MIVKMEMRLIEGFQTRKYVNDESIVVLNLDSETPPCRAFENC